MREPNGAPRILVAGRNLVYEAPYGQFAYPEGDHASLAHVVKPLYAINVRRKPHAPVH